MSHDWLFLFCAMPVIAAGFAARSLREIRRHYKAFPDLHPGFREATRLWWRIAAFVFPGGPELMVLAQQTHIVSLYAFGAALCCYASIWTYLLGGTAINQVRYIAYLDQYDKAVKYLQTPPHRRPKTPPAPQVHEIGRAHV
jgi:hypothetical protein